MVEQITQVFLTGRADAGAVINGGVIVVGVEGKQLWKNIMLNLKHALVKLFGEPPRNVYGHRKKDKSIYVWPVDEGVYNWSHGEYKNKFDVFEHYRKHKMHTRIILKKNGTFTIRKPGN
jgi:hypothetical protein